MRKNDPQAGYQKSDPADPERKSKLAFDVAARRQREVLRAHNR